MTHRTTSLAVSQVFAVAIVLFLAAPTRAAEDNPERTAVEFMTPAAAPAVTHGSAFLAQQQHDDGSFGSGGYARDVAVCALAGMAFMAGGSSPGRGQYGTEVSRCVDFIIENTQDSGFINVPGSGSH